jgi:phosphoenolpyruvate carboxykinase (GTP)
MATAPQFATLSSISPAVADWVESVRQLTTPDQVYWCDGTAAELARLKQALEKSGELKQLNPSTFPNCHLAYSHPSDVARVEHLTFICTRNREDAGPNNNWMDPAEAHVKMRSLFTGCMKGRTLYVVPYCMGPIDSPYSRCGVEITDSAYVVINMAIMTRMGRQALERIARDGTFVKGLHSIGELDPNRRFIMHFPEELSIESFGSGYGGKCVARQEVPCAAHRELAGACRGLARRAHAHRRPRESPGRDALHRRGLPVGLRQDEPRDADPAGLDARLEGLDRGR